jgi:anti-sigma factor ChrR (cupin superfamily)
MGILRHSLKELISIQVNDEILRGLEWKDFGNGLSMSRLARDGRGEFVLYRIRSDADPNAFLRHEHIGGEFYLMVKGRIEDEYGVYEEGDIVYLNRGSVHSPRAFGETIVLVLWPEGVRILE